MTSARVRLGKLCHVVTKGTTPTSVGLEFADVGVPFLRIVNLKNRTVVLEDVLFISEETNKSLKRSRIQPNDFLLTIAGTIGKVAIVPPDFPECNCNQALAILRFDYEKLNPQFLLHWLATNDAQNQITGKKVTGVISNLSLGQIKELQVPLPTLAEQQKIAEILDAADALRQKDQQLIDHYTALSQSLFLDMFGDPIQNPMGWSVKKLKDLTSAVMSGNTPAGGSKVYTKNGILFLRSQNVWKNKIDYSDAVFLSDEIHLKMKKTSLKKRDILMTKTGRFNTENSSLGRAALFTGENDTANLNGHVYLIRLLDKEIAEFVLHILTTDQYRDYIRRVCVGGIDKRQLNKSHLEDFPILCPPPEKQKKFVEQIKLIHKQKQQAEASLAQSNNLFNSLLQKAFTGELTQQSECAA